MSNQSLLNRFSSDKCSHCGGPAPGWKCARCGHTFSHYDPEHWKECRSGGKCEAQCQKCGEAEDNCTCTSG